MTARRPCPPAPGPLEDYATQFDPLLSSLAQRRGPRNYLQGLLLPRDRNKTLTALADAEPVVGRPASPGPAAAVVLVGVDLGPRGGQPAADHVAADRSGHRARPHLAAAHPDPLRLGGNRQGAQGPGRWRLGILGRQQPRTTLLHPAGRRQAGQLEDPAPLVLG
jgi:hypothetical protein